MRGVSKINNYLRMEGENKSTINQSYAQEESKADYMNQVSAEE